MSTEGHNLARDPNLTLAWSRGGERLSRVLKSDRGEDGSDLIVVTEVGVDGAVEWEGDRGGSESLVDL